ncbi:M28 family peptidase [Gaetbulibacter saemankumensis]|uniref:M28 family peptidase n=1 Tax=Gaetbulibacter saemankumensis TaxID=311208 RepID=UPI00048A37CF|nr:M28 family peptidase [Gaetbulibacter saemankumensis]
MKTYLHLLVLLWFGITLNGYGQDQVLQEVQFSKSELLKHCQSLSSDGFQGRHTGTKGALKARKYIINQFHRQGLAPIKKDTYTQLFYFSERGVHYEGANVLGLIKGKTHPDHYVVISAHYDHLGVKDGQIYNGADDNASGLSALFSFAEYFKNNPPNNSVVLAAFDAEELGLRGSKYFVMNPIITFAKIKLNINLDMIGRSDKRELYVVGTRESEVLRQVVLSIKDTGKLHLKIGHDGGNWKDDWTLSSDHASFYKFHVPFLYFGVEDHADYHEPSDIYENIQPDFYYEAVKTVIKVFSKLDSSQF